jgi:hypothetical protein
MTMNQDSRNRSKTSFSSRRAEILVDVPVDAGGARTTASTATASVSAAA